MTNAKSTAVPPPGARRLRALFSRAVAGTVGVEEELLVVRRGSWLPADADAVIAAVGDPRVKREQPACQLEIAVRSC